MVGQKILDILEYVNQHSEYVKIDVDKISAFICKNNNWHYHYWLEDLRDFLDERQCIIFAFLCESINFCFWGNEEYNSEYVGSEIRANTLYAIEIMKNLLLKQGVVINSVQLDNLIWRMRHNVKHTIPVHRTRTTCY